MMSKFAHGVKHLVHEMIPPAAFFFVAFHLLAFTRALILEQYGIKLSSFLAATIGALVVAKVILLADLLPFINRFPGRPLIYNIVWKTAIYFVAAYVVRYLEEVLHYCWHEGHIAGVGRHMVEEVVWPHFWAIQIWLTVLLLIYCTLHELVRALGRDRFTELFFGTSRKAAPEI